MDFKCSNTCKILLNRETLQNPIACNHLITDRLNRKTVLLYKKDLLSHYGCVNAIEFSNNGQYLVSGVFVGHPEDVLLNTPNLVALPVFQFTAAILSRFVG